MSEKQKFFYLIFIIFYNNRDVVSESDNAIKKKPHIVLIVADDLGWNDVSFHGSNQVPTPNIDALAYNGVILNRHYVLPMCTPTRSALLTGRYPLRNGMQGWPIGAGEARALPLNNTLLPEYLRGLGYATSLVGKWHIGYFSPNRTPARRGFDTFFGYYNGLMTYFGHWFAQKIDNSTKKVGQDVHQDTPESLNPTRRSGYFTDVITEEALKIIRSNGNDKPLFLEVSHLAIHASDNEVEPLEVRDMAEVNATFAHIKDVRRRKCAGMIKALDESVGRIVQALGDHNMLENSIVVFMSDNGAPTVGLRPNAGSNYPLRGGKSTPYEGGVRGAACIYSSLIKESGRLSEQLMHVTDWLPTLYAAAGGDLVDLKDIDGVNLWPHITLNTESPRKSLLVDIDEIKGGSSGIMERFKLIKNSASSHGESSIGCWDDNPPYEIQEVLSESRAGAAIGRLQRSATSDKAAKILRANGTVRCDEYTRSRADCTTYCLFDLKADPCETTDVSRRHPEILKELDEFIEGYRKVLMPQQVNVTIDPRSFPENFGGFWMPWLEDDFPHLFEGIFADTL